MKCEKCGIDILDGTLCENCKNINSVSETNVVSANVSVIPQAYDPVVDLMNETVIGSVNFEKSEAENAVPLGDNTGIPEAPVGEDVVNVLPQVEPVNIPVVEDVVVSPEVVEEPVVASEPVQEVSAAPVVEITEKKKLSTGSLIGIAIAVVVLGVLAYFGIMFLGNYKEVSGMFDQSRATTFVTEVQVAMDKAKTEFMTLALQSENAGESIEFISNSQTSLHGVDQEYKIVLNGNGEFTKIIIFDENFCFSISNELDENIIIDKTSITVSSLLPRSKKDNLSVGCLGVKK